MLASTLKTSPVETAGILRAPLTLANLQQGPKSISSKSWHISIRSSFVWMRSIEVRSGFVGASLPPGGRTSAVSRPLADDPANDPARLESKTKLRILKEKKEQFSKILESSEGLRNELRDGLGELLGKDVISSSVHPNFHTQHDPTLLIGHIESAWPHDWLDSLPVRVNTEITTWESRGDSADIHSLIGLDKLPDSIRDTAAALVGEIINLSTDDSYNKDGTKTDKGDVKAAKPAYHDIDPRNETKRERWNDTQPFFPLFLEWEARYAHIDYSQWSLDERAFTSQGSAKMGYGMMNDDPLYDRPDWAASKAEQNLRILSGRVLVLPQTSFALQAQVDSVLDQMPAKDLEEAFRDIDITPDQLR
jgi:hypothetical protein